MSEKPRKAVYAGSFDPLTNGHLWMIKQGLDLFDHLTVAIGINPDKEYTYGVNERIDILHKSLPKVENISISFFENEIKKLLKFCDLKFEQGCIDFYKTKRTVRTPSSEQVRQPIYKKGIGQWKNYS